ncbi:MAG TPA: ParB N-terminal domain-containing protein [Methanosarcinales archaeon]|nr:ParB N-terminal domain-containing protein [Methanosarcinales archaeon]
MQIKLMPINTLKPYANNPRDNKKAVDKVAESLKIYGWQQPIVADQDNIIIIGHTPLAGR